MAGKYDINDVALIALESMYRGFGFNRVVFFLMNKNKKELDARFGYGKDIERIAKDLVAHWKDRRDAGQTKRPYHSGYRGGIHQQTDPPVVPAPFQHPVVCLSTDHI